MKEGKKTTCKDCGREIETTNDDIDLEKVGHFIQCHDCYQEACDYIEFLEQQDRYDDFDDFDDYLHLEDNDEYYEKYYFKYLLIEKKM